MPGISPLRPPSQCSLVHCSSGPRATAAGTAAALQGRSPCQGGFAARLRPALCTVQRRSSLERLGEPGAGIINHCCYYFVGTKRGLWSGCARSCCCCKHRAAAVRTPWALTDPDQPHPDAAPSDHRSRTSVRIQFGALRPFPGHAAAMPPSALGPAGSPISWMGPSDQRCGPASGPISFCS